MCIRSFTLPPVAIARRDDKPENPEMLPINPARLPKMLDEANALVRRGKGAEALELYRTVASADPENPEVHHRMGLLLLRATEFEAAARVFATAAKLRPSESVIWDGYTEALIRLDDKRESRRVLKLLERSPLDPETKARYANRLAGRSVPHKVSTGTIPPRELQSIIKLMNERKFAAAEKRTRTLLHSNPGLAILHAMLGTALREQRKTDEAITAFGQAARFDPNYPEALYNLGKILLDNRRAREAITPLERVRSLTPGSATALVALARAYLETGKMDMAGKTANAAVGADPGNAVAYFTRARISERNNDNMRARDDLAKCLSLGLKNGHVRLVQSKVLNALGEREAALDAAERAIALMPEDGDALGTRAIILQTNGDFDAADAAFREAFRIAPTNGTNYRLYSASHEFTAADPLIGRMQGIYERKDLTDRDRMQLGFALSKAMEDTEQYDRVFPYLNRSSRAMRAQYPYDTSRRRREVDLMKAAFSGFDPCALNTADRSDYAPIFVTGLPRSGTTLVEQILSSHSTVIGAGEVGRFSRQGYRLALPPDRRRHADEIREGELKALADDYGAHMRALHPAHDRIVDKSIQTYFMMGLVWMALPKARIVVVRRDPRDNLLSLYKNVFPEGTHLYSYDLRDLGRYYLMFVEMIGFWRNLRPDGFHEVRYENLIADPDGEIRKIVAACDLEWEDACLDFHRNERRVDTLSVYQVRQPIYNSSAGAWQRHEKELQPLFDSLGDLTTGDQISSPAA